MSRKNDPSITVEQLMLELSRCRRDREDALRTIHELQRERADHQAISRIGTWRRDSNEDTVHWSDQVYLIHGLPIGMPVSRDGVLDLILDEDRERVQQTYENAIAKQLSFRIVYRIRRPDGEIRVLHADNLVQRDPVTDVVTIHGAVHDITDPSDISNLIPHVGGQFPDHCLVVDTDGIVLRSNGSLRQLLSDSEPGGSVFRLFAPGTSHDRLEEAMDAVESGAGRHHVLLKPDGAANGDELELAIEPWEDHGQFRGFVLSPAEMVLEGSYETSGPHSPVDKTSAQSGAWVIDFKTQEVIWSAGMFDILDMDRDATPLSREAFYECVHPDDREWVQEMVASFYEIHDPVTFSFRLVSMKGQVKRVVTHLESISRSGPNSHSFGSMTDVTDQDALHQVTRRQQLEMDALRISLGNMNLRLMEANLKLSKAQEEERSRIAVELHDRAGGLVTSLNLKLNLMAEDGVAAHLSEARDMLDQLGQQIRQTTRQLRPNALNRFGIEAALKELAQDLGTLGGLSLTLDIDKLGTRLDSRTATKVFRIAREAILNVVRHARATRLTVGFHQHADGVQLLIEDDGRGFNLEESLASDSIGLESMFDRADSLGGRLTITSRPDTGTRVDMLIPFSKRNS